MQYVLFYVLATDERKIVGGEEVDPIGRYPYQVAMINGGSQYCGGSLVDKDWVLCAAHCHGIGSSVYIGRHDLTDSGEDYETLEVEWETKHPDYNDNSLNNDFMMVKLKESSSYSPVKLDSGSTNVDAGAKVTVMGWGTTSFQGSSSDVLMEVEVDVVSNSDCNSDYSGGITNNMICASRAGKDSCQGDSGGPLIVKGADASSDVQVGVVSWGNGCAYPDYPGVYARVSSQIEWIEEQIASGTKPDDEYYDGSNNDYYDGSNNDYHDGYNNEDDCEGFSMKSLFKILN